MNDALKPCPFCGGEARYDAEGRNYGIAHCAKVGCLAHHYEQDEQGGWNHSDTKAEAIAAWNRRAPERNPDNG